MQKGKAVNYLSTQIINKTKGKPDAETTGLKRNKLQKAKRELISVAPESRAPTQESPGNPLEKPRVMRPQRNKR